MPDTYIYLAELIGPEDDVRVITFAMTEKDYWFDGSPWKSAHREATLLNFAHGWQLRVWDVVREGTSMPIDCYTAKKYRAEQAWLRG